VRVEMSDATERALAAGHVARWLVATERQAQRVDEERGKPPPNSAQVEATLFALALRNVLRAAKYADRFEPERISRAIVEFDDAIPHAMDVRNILDHFDEYESGTGRLQNEGDTGLIEWYEDVGTTYQLVFVVGGQERRLDVGAARDAARRLAGEVLAAIHGL
jgi:UDP-N-acetylmuramoylalanine-D-glutamate ligase